MAVRTDAYFCWVYGPNGCRAASFDFDCYNEVATSVNGLAALADVWNSFNRGQVYLLWQVDSNLFEFESGNPISLQKRHPVPKNIKTFEEAAEWFDQFVWKASLEAAVASESLGVMYRRGGQRDVYAVG